LWRLPTRHGRFTMKIAFVDENLSLRTGSRRFTYEVAHHLQDMGHEVRILTTNIDKEKCFKEYLYLPIEVISGDNPSNGGSAQQSRHQNHTKNPLLEIINYYSYYLTQMRLAIDISERIADTKCEVALIHYHGEHWLLPYFYCLNGALGSVFLNMIPPMPRPLALPFQELTLRRRLVDNLLGLPPISRWKESSFKKLSLFLAPSRFLLEQAERLGVIGHRKAAVIPLGVNHSQFYPMGEEEPFALYLGRIHPHKSIELAVLSMKNTPRDYSLVIAGDIEEQHMWYKDKLLSLAEKVGISDRFKIILHPSDSEVVQLMQKCSVFLFPSTIDTFGLVVLEAMSCGKPIVACNRGGVPEIVGEAGFLLEPSIEQWQMTVNKLLSDSSFRQEMGRKALERSKAFSWKKTTERLLLAFKHVGAHSEVQCGGLKQILPMK
jgi:glycosyltransferase involved in cell wall biosynthesis